MSEMLRTARIAARVDETPEIVALDLAPLDGGSLPRYAAGAHIDVEIRPGLVRQYSLLAPPSGQTRYRIGVLKDPASRGGSVALHALDVGDTVRISTPRNHFPLASGAHSSLLFAGGIGVTPLLCMAEQLWNDAAPFTLHYCARSESHAAFLPMLRAAPYAARTKLHFDDGAAAQKLDIDAVLAAAPSGTHLYVCGPTGFMDWILAAAERARWPDARVHREYFKPAEPPPGGGNTAFQVRVGRNGAVIDVPADRSIVAALLEHGIDLPISCESGVCGTCLTGVLEGEPEHRDYFLTAEEKARNDQILPCCSRARSPLLVLDL